MSRGKMFNWKFAETKEKEKRGYHRDLLERFLLPQHRHKLCMSMDQLDSEGGRDRVNGGAGGGGGEFIVCGGHVHFYVTFKFHGEFQLD